MGFSHLDADGNAIMVDVSGKTPSPRKAVAAGSIRMSRSCFDAIQQGRSAKGDVLGVAQIAGIQAAKRTSELIPLCHNLALTNSEVRLRLDDEACAVQAVCTVRCEGKTGAEMEALTGVSVALLTVYDMCKALDPRMEITGIHLLEKSGGKSGIFRREDTTV